MIQPMATISSYLKYCLLLILRNAFNLSEHMICVKICIVRDITGSIHKSNMKVFHILFTIVLNFVDSA